MIGIGLDIPTVAVLGGANANSASRFAFRSDSGVLTSDIGDILSDSGIFTSDEGRLTSDMGPFTSDYGR